MKLKLPNTIDNPNINPIMDMFMDINFNEEFTYVSNSLQIILIINEIQETQEYGFIAQKK